MISAENVPFRKRLQTAFVWISVFRKLLVGKSASANLYYADRSDRMMFAYFRQHIPTYGDRE
jgi:hypothetical protein